MRRIIPIHSGPPAFSFDDNAGGITNGIGNAVSAYLSSIPQRAQIEMERSRADASLARQSRLDGMSESHAAETERHNRAMESVPHHQAGDVVAGGIAPSHLIDELSYDLTPTPKVDIITGEVLKGPDGQPLMTYHKAPRKDAPDRLRRAGIDPDTYRFMDPSKKPASAAHGDDAIGGLLGGLGGLADPIMSFLHAAHNPTSAPTEGQDTMPPTDAERADLNALADQSAHTTAPVAVDPIDAPLDITPAGMTQQQDALGQQLAALTAPPAAHPAAAGPDPALQAALASLSPSDLVGYQRVMASGDPRKIALANERLLRMAGGPLAGVR